MKTKVIRYDIEINFIPTVDGAINPIKRADGSIDEAALSDYQEFLINVLSVLDEHEYEVMKAEESNRSETSYYITAYKKSESTNENIKCIFFIRVSDHGLNTQTEKQRSQYYKEQAEQLKQPKSKRKQTWRFKNITVNGEKFDSYDEALEEVDQKLR